MEKVRNSYPEKKMMIYESTGEKKNINRKPTILIK